MQSQVTIEEIGAAFGELIARLIALNRALIKENDVLKAEIEKLRQQESKE